MALPATSTGMRSSSSAARCESHSGLKSTYWCRLENTSAASSWSGRSRKRRKARRSLSLWTWNSSAGACRCAAPAAAAAAPARSRRGHQHGLGADLDAPGAPGDAGAAEQLGVAAGPRSQLELGAALAPDHHAGRAPVVKTDAGDLAAGDPLP